MRTPYTTVDTRLDKCLGFHNCSQAVVALAGNIKMPYYSHFSQHIKNEGRKNPAHKCINNGWKGELTSPQHMQKGCSSSCGQSMKKVTWQQRCSLWQNESWLWILGQKLNYRRKEKGFFFLQSWKVRWEDHNASGETLGTFFSYVLLFCVIIY